jgi:hypothetical protein
MRHHLATVVAAITTVVILAVAGVLVLAHTHQHTPTSTSVISSSAPRRAVTSTSPNGHAPSPSPAPASAPTRTRNESLLLSAIRAFASAYALYLDGASKTAIGRAGSLTAAAQAAQGGRIPVAFRDGPLKVKALDSLEQTCCSATVTVVLEDRQQTYPFTQNLLLEDGRWLVDQITPTDLSMDRTLPAAGPVTEPAGGEASARAFATAYVDYRTAISGTVPAMTTAAARQIRAGTDSLAGQKLPNAPGRLVSIQFGPPSGSEFAATATVAITGARVSFSFLMVRTRAGWECGQFL